MGEPPIATEAEWRSTLGLLLEQCNYCGMWDACEIADMLMQARASYAPLYAAYARMADPAWRACNTDAYCNTPRQLWAQAWWEARDFEHQARARRG